jgi:hypothetical protein
MKMLLNHRKLILVLATKHRQRLNKIRRNLT